VSAPDYAEALIGWRVWCVVRRGAELRLGSVIQDDVWPIGTPFVARCRAHEPPANRSLLREPERHVVPAADCTCGIYAAREPAGAWTYLRGRDDARTVTRVIGRVALWGRVVEHEDGWRAERAYPLDVYTGDPELRRRLGSVLDAHRTALRHARERDRARRDPGRARA
jgi:hypothetical protein